MAEQERNRRFPQYLSSPVQVLWFEADELAIILLSFMVASIFKGYFWFTVLIAPFLYTRYKLRYPRGFLKHMLYFSGIKELQHYPSAFHKEFLE